jgi:2-oxoglutarate ferredoxin oxidoreductase subunit beta
MCEFLSTLDGTAYLERTSVHSPKHIQKTKKAIRQAFQTQLSDEGFSMVEILSQCPSNWKMSAVDSSRWIEEGMIPQFPLGIVKQRETEPS